MAASVITHEGTGPRQHGARAQVRDPTGGGFDVAKFGCRGRSVARLNPSHAPASRRAPSSLGFPSRERASPLAGALTGEARGCR
jgi:hypothetical protein